MLYNGENNDNNEENFDIHYEKKLNIKKVVVFISSVAICLFILLGSFLLTYNSMNKTGSEKQNNEQIVAEEENKVEEKDTISKEIVSAFPTLNTNKKAKKYEGSHVQIAIHSGDNIRKSFVPAENPNAQEQIKQIYYSNEKQVYLTFDDGPSKTVSNQVLDILKRENVPATFFVLGSRVELNPDVIKREFNEGHFIANHGYSHKYSQMYANSDNVYEEYLKCEQAVKNALGNQDYNTRLFRFPGGSSGGPYNKVKAEAKIKLEEKGIASTNWNALTGDAEGIKEKDKLIERMISTVNGSNSVVLLMHDAGDKSYTVEALPEVIKYFKERGYVFKNFYEFY